MSIEEAVLSLANAINNLASVYSGAAPAFDGSANVTAEAPKRGRKKTEETILGADALVPDTSGDGQTRVQERMNQVAEGGKVKVVDAGTGQTVELPAEGAAADVGALRTEAKTLGIRLIGSNPALEASVQALIRKHSGIADGSVTFGKVPDAAIPAFLADLKAQAAMAD